MTREEAYIGGQKLQTYDLSVIIGGVFNDHPLAPVESVSMESAWFLLIGVDHQVAFDEGGAPTYDVGPSGLELRQELRPCRPSICL